MERKQTHTRSHWTTELSGGHTGQSSLFINWHLVWSQGESSPWASAVSCSHTPSSLLEVPRICKRPKGALVTSCVVPPAGVCVGSPEGATRVGLWGLRGCLRGRLTSFFSHSPSTCASQLKFHTCAGGWRQVCLTERKANTTTAASSILIDSYCLGEAEERPWRKKGRDPEAEKREKAGERSPSLQTQDGLWGWGKSVSSGVSSIPQHRSPEEAST